MFITNQSSVKYILKTFCDIFRLMMEQSTQQDESNIIHLLKMMK